MAWHRPARQITGMSFYGFKIWHRRFHGLFSRPAEVWPWEVRFAHPCRAHARHPIHKAMGGHASHGHTSDRAFMKRVLWSSSLYCTRRQQETD